MICLSLSSNTVANRTTWKIAHIECSRGLIITIDFLEVVRYLQYQNSIKLIVKKKFSINEKGKVTVNVIRIKRE